MMVQIALLLTKFVQNKINNLRLNFSYAILQPVEFGVMQQGKTEDRSLIHNRLLSTRLLAPKVLRLCYGPTKLV